MKIRNYIYWFFSFLIGGLCVYIFFRQLSSNEQTILNLFSLLGTYASIFGLVIALVQIFRLKQISEITQLEVQSTQKRINQLVSVAELSKANKIIQEIQHFISTDKYDLCLLRMRDLKEIVIQSKCSSDLHKFTSTTEYNEIIQKLSEDLVNISDFVKTKKRVNLSVINKNLENISTTILKFENNLKTFGYDNN